MSRVPTKLYLPPSAARHQVDSAQRTAGGGFGTGRAVCRERHKKACTGAFEGDTVKRLRPSKVSMGSVSPQEQGLQGLATYHHSQASCSHRPPLWVKLLLSSFRVSMAPVEFGL